MNRDTLDAVDGRNDDEAAALIAALSARCGRLADAERLLRAHVALLRRAVGESEAVVATRDATILALRDEVDSLRRVVAARDEAIAWLQGELAAREARSSLPGPARTAGAGTATTPS